MMRFFRHMPQGHEVSDKTNRMTTDESAADRKDLDKPQSLLQRLSRKISETCEKIRMRRLLRRARGIYYIGGSDVLPEPLDSEEERRCLAAYAAGSDEARSILIEHNLRLVAHVVKKYQGTGEDTDDLISIGTIGLIKAVTTFNPQKASRLSTYAARCIENELLMYFRAKKKHSKEVSLYEPIGTDKEGNEINLLDVIESAPVDIVEDCYIRENTDYLLRSLKKVLSDKEYQVICCRYGLFGMEEETQREIARKLCISRSYVSRIEKTALQKLRGLFPQMQ